MKNLSGNSDLILRATEAIEVLKQESSMNRFAFEKDHFVCNLEKWLERRRREAGNSLGSTFRSLGK